MGKLDFKKMRIYCIMLRVSKRKTKNGCILWKGHTRNGYGITLGWDNKKHTVTRLIYELCYGKFNKKLLVCHSCDNPTCVNPEHLWLGTPKQNSQDMTRKGRGLKGRTWFKKIKQVAPKDVSVTIKNAKLTKKRGLKK